jgi:hypothetical protein
MLRRIIIILGLALLPVSALAADASSLGPQATNPSVSSPDTGGVLQPANPQSLQSGADTTTLVAPDSSSLQPAGTKSNLADTLSGEVDGAGPQTAAVLSTSYATEWWTIGAFIALAALYALYYITHTTSLKRRYS